MISPKIENGDLVFNTENDFVMLEGDEELSQCVKCELSTYLNEFFLEEEHGLNRENIHGKQADHDETRNDIIEAVSHEERVVSIEDIFITDDRNKRKRIISLTLKKEDGKSLEIDGVEIDA